MNDSPPQSLFLYRGYVVYFYNSEERVDPLPTQTGGFFWQSVEKLEEALQEAIANGKAAHPDDVTTKKDIGGYVEKIPLQLHAQILL
jgi:hypothetical protein